jgi:hypothetical protein
MALFDDIFTEIKGKVVDLAKTEVKDFADSAAKDTKDYLQTSKEKLKKWTLLLVDKKIDGEEFEFLVNSQIGLGEMKVLTNVGIAQIKAEKFKNAVIHLVVDTILTRVLKV